jgi:hypothetical protein
MLARTRIVATTTRSRLTYPPTSSSPYCCHFSAPQPVAVRRGQCPFPMRMHVSNGTTFRRKLRSLQIFFLLFSDFCQVGLPPRPLIPLLRIPPRRRRSNASNRVHKSSRRVMSRAQSFFTSEASRSNAMQVVFSTWESLTIT